MNAELREHIRQVRSDAALADRAEVLWIHEGVVPLEGDLLAEIRRLRNLCNRKQARIRKLEASRREWRRRATLAEHDAELLRSGLEMLTR